MRKTILILSACVWTLSAWACKPQKPIVILHDNDVHCAIERYPQLRSLYDAMRTADTAYVGLASSGDLVQGAVAGTLSRGQQIIDVLREMPYDAITLGNHEFDYGVPRMLELMEQFGTERVSCVNFSDRADNYPFGRYVIKQYGRTKVAYIGVLTPTAMRDEQQAFISAEGDTLYRLQDYDKVVELVQQQVNAARKAGAKYVVVLSHLGEKDVPLTSVKLIEKTYGIDAVLDGHTHSKIAQQMVTNSRGKQVALTQTGQKLDNIGKLYIGRDGKIETSIVSLKDYKDRDARVQAVVDSINTVNAPVINRKVGYSEVRLTNLGADGKRAVRNSPTNTGDLAADATRWYCGAELALVNGGGLRKDIEQGDVTLGEIIDMQPFNNDLNLYAIPAKTLVKMIEYACSGLLTEEETGLLIHPSGFGYVYSKEEKKLVDIFEIDDTAGVCREMNMERVYSVGMASYNFLQFGEIVKDCEVIRANIGMDNMATKEYIETALDGHIGQEYAKPQGRLTIK